MKGYYIRVLTPIRGPCYLCFMAKKKKKTHLARFDEWVDKQGGPTKAAALLDTSRPTVDNLLGGSTPSLKTATAIEKLVGIKTGEWVG